jgi:hypothetical protein
MLACSRHAALRVAAPPIPTWIALLREAQIAAEGRKSNTGVTLPPDSKLPEGVHQALLEVRVHHAQPVVCEEAARHQRYHLSTAACCV